MYIEFVNYAIKFGECISEISRLIKEFAECTIEFNKPTIEIDQRITQINKLVIEFAQRVTQINMLTIEFAKSTSPLNKRPKELWCNTVIWDFFWSMANNNALIFECPIFSCLSIFVTGMIFARRFPLSLFC